ncbi:MAG: 50S ribosomal protein L9 [Ignavibacteria bacterium]|nr:50S ribosomal protein L9 [Ignavibacteria bacterium]
MKVLLKQDHEKLGNAGEVKEVKKGYARNFLIPKGIAVLATESNQKSFEEINRQQGRKIRREIELAKKTSFELEKDTLVIYAKAGEEEKLFGSVTSQIIHDKLAEKGYNIDKRKIIMHEHIKTLGEHEVDVRLYTDVTAKIKLVVKDEKELEKPETEDSESEVVN